MRSWPRSTWRPEIFPQNQLPGQTPTADLYNAAGPFTDFAPAAISQAGGGQSHSNLAPFLCVNFIVALFGVYPSRDKSEANE